MSSTEEEKDVRRTSPFAQEVVEEGALEIEDGVGEKSVFLTPHLSSVSMQQGEELSAFGEF